MSKEELKNLPPEERIKKLKELEKKKKKELEEAEKLIKESQDEITDKDKFKEKVPIPEVAKEDLEGLSQEGKNIIKEQRGLTSKKKQEESSEDSKKKPDNLEDTLFLEKIDLPPEISNSQYALHLSHEPIKELKKEMTNIYKMVEDKGYMNEKEQRKVQYLTSAVEKKLEDVEVGKYSLTEEVARAASLTQQLGASLSIAYHSGKKKMYHS